MLLPERVACYTSHWSGRQRNGMSKELSYKVIIGACEEGRFIVCVPSLPGCVSEGGTYQQAFINIKEAIRGWIEVSRECQRCTAQHVICAEVCNVG